MTSSVKGWVLLVPVLVAVLAYANAPANGFAYDDVHIVVDDDALAEPGELPGRLARPYWPEDATGQLGLWRPATTAFLAAQRWLFGLEPAGFHVVNVLLHGLVTGLVTLLAGSLAGSLAALPAGLLFAVHPVHVEAVANVVGVAELLSSAAYLAACLLFLRRVPAAGVVGSGGQGDAAPSRQADPVALILIPLLYALGILAKESAITLPAALLLLDAVRQPVPLRGAGAWLRSRAPLLGAMAVTAGIVLGLRWWVLGALADPDAPLGGHLLLDIPRVWTLGVVWFHYVRLLVFPVTLSSDYGPDVIPVLTVWTSLGMAGVAAVVALLGASLAAWRRGPGGRLPGLAVVWFVVTVSPVANVAFLSGILLAERTLYLPSVGAAVLAGGLLSRAPARRPAGRLALLLVLGALAARTWTRTPTWESTETVFETLIVEQPRSGRAWWVIGDALEGEGRTAEARRAWSRAIGHLDSSYRLLMEVGWWSWREERDARLSTFLFRRAWEQRPSLASAPRRLAVVHAAGGDHEETAFFARRVTEIEPGDVVSWHLLAGALEGLERWDEAVAARRQVLALGEDVRWQQWIALARTELARGDTARAREAASEALARADSEEVREAIRRELETVLGGESPS